MVLKTHGLPGTHMKMTINVLICPLHYSLSSDLQLLHNIPSHPSVGVSQRVYSRNKVYDLFSINITE